MAKKALSRKEFQGFVKNEGDKGYFTLQRRLPPGGKLQLQAAYLTIGHQSGTEDEEEFINWLRENVLSGPDWVFYKKEDVPYFSEKVEDTAPEVPLPVAPARGAGRKLKRSPRDKVATGSAVTADAIIKAEYSQAKGLIDKCKERPVLKKALALTKHFANKESHMRHLMRRLEQV